MQDHDVMVAPLFSGSGMRIKIMEGMALGKPIITTTVGAEGIEITDRVNIFIADTPEAMMETIDFCVNNLQKCTEIGKNAKKLIETKYTQEIITQELTSFITNTYGQKN
jgi:glycosyltransferase involved in cell wall biosynthesis